MILVERMLAVEVIRSEQEQRVVSKMLMLPAGSTVRDAILAAGWGDADQSLDGLVGVWGRKVGLEALVQHGDRVEIYRLLKVDPKVARRERFKRQGARASGLFAGRRPGAKPGY